MNSLNKINLIVAVLSVIQISALATGCQTAKVKETADNTKTENTLRKPASLGGLDAGIDALVNASRMSRGEVTQIIEQQVLRNTTTVSAVIGTANEGAVLSSIIRKLEATNSPLAAALHLSGTSKATALTDLKAAQQAMIASANRGTDVGNTGAGGFGIPSTQTQDENVRLINRLQGQLKADLLEANTNAMAGARRVPANEKTLKRIIKTAAQIAQNQGAEVLGKMKCVANGDLSDPEAIENLAEILDTVMGSGNRDLVQAWTQASVSRIGRDTRCQLANNSCDVLNSNFSRGCGE